MLKEWKRRARGRENIHKDKKLRFILGPEAKSKYVAADFDDDIAWFAKSDEESIEIRNADEKLKSMLTTRVIALKKAKKVENVKVVSRTEKGKLVGLWLAKK